MHFPLVDLARMTIADGENAILKNRWPKITSAEDLLSSSILGHTTTTGIRVAVIKNSFDFLECQTMAENRVNAETIQGVPDNAKRLRMIANTSPSILGQTRMNEGHLKVDNNIPILGIEGANKEQRLVWNMVL